MLLNGKMDGIEEDIATIEASSKWKSHKSVLGAIEINLPPSFNEILIAFSLPENDYTIESTLIIPYIDLTNTAKYYDVGTQFATLSYGYRVRVTKNVVQLNDAWKNGASVSSSVTVTVCYR